MKSQPTTILTAAYAAIAICSTGAFAQNAAEPSEKVEQRVQRLEQQVGQLRGEIGNAGLAAFIAGSLCALWAQNSRPQRNPWVWFFFGLILAPIALIAMLIKNSNDQDGPGEP